MITKEEARKAWETVKQYALGDAQPFVTSDQIRKLDEFFSAFNDDEPKCNGILVHQEYTTCPRCDR